MTKKKAPRTVAKSTLVRKTAGPRKAGPRGKAPTGVARTSAARKTTPQRKTARTAVRKPATRRRTVRRRSPFIDTLLAPVTGAESRDLGHVRLDVGRAGEGRVKRLIYPPGFRWSVDMRPVVGTDLCMHAHVGFLVHGEIHIEYADGCVVEHRAPQVVAIDPGHDGWVVGSEPVVLIEFDFEGDTVRRLGMPKSHTHA